MKIGNRTFDLNSGHCYIMGILNVTPDSFSDGGKFDTLDNALFHAEAMVKEGADLVDVGGESTRPGHIQISSQEEIERVVPVIEGIKSRLDIPVSIDTYKADVCEAALKAGADLVNDIWGFKADPKMAPLTAKYDVPCCLMHNRHEANYENFQVEFLNDLWESVQIARAGGVKDEKIILDPGVGFGKNYELNLEIINNLEIMKKLGFPILLATSRKSVIGLTLDLPATERVEGTLATTVLGILKGASFVRVHDIKENARIIRMTEAILAH